MKDSKTEDSKTEDGKTEDLVITYKLRSDSDIKRFELHCSKHGLSRAALTRGVISFVLAKPYLLKDAVNYLLSARERGEES